MRSHGTGMACYKGDRPVTGSCEDCRTTNTKWQIVTMRRYRTTAKGQLAMARANAARRGNR